MLLSLYVKYKLCSAGEYLRIVRKVGGKEEHSDACLSGSQHLLALSEPRLCAHVAHWMSPAASYTLRSVEKLTLHRTHLLEILVLS